MAGAAAVLRGKTVLAGIGREVRTNRAGDDALTLLVALHIAAELLDYPHGFVTNGQAGGDGVLTLENVYIGAADGRGGDADQGVVGSDVGDGFVNKLDSTGFDERGGSHHGHDAFLAGWVRTL